MLRGERLGVRGDRRGKVCAARIDKLRSAFLQNPIMTVERFVVSDKVEHPRLRSFMPFELQADFVLSVS